MSELEQAEKEWQEEQESFEDVPSSDEEMTPEAAQSALDRMLSSAPDPAPEEKFVISRLKMTVTLCGVSERDIDIIGRRCERPPTRAEKARGIVTTQRDVQKFNLLLTTAGMRDPDLNDQRLRERYGNQPEMIVQTWFLPGEIVQMADKVMDLSGYSDDAVVQAKK